MPTARDQVEIVCPSCAKVVSMRREKFEANIDNEARCGDCLTTFPLVEAVGEAPPQPVVVLATRRVNAVPTPPPTASTAPAWQDEVTQVDPFFECHDCEGQFTSAKVYSLGGNIYVCHRCHAAASESASATQMLPMSAADALQMMTLPPEMPGSPVVINNVINNATTVIYHAPQRWNRGTAALLSFFIPGVGQMYKGQPINGLLWLILTAVGYAFFILPGLILHFCCIVGASSGDTTR